MNRIQRSRGIAALVFLTAVGLFTWKLLQPQPLPEAVVREIRSVSEAFPFLVAKSAHILGYAFLMIVGGIAFPSRRERIALLAMLAAHAIATEVGQTFVPNRTGRGLDVVIDFVGIAIGAAILRILWPVSRFDDDGAPNPILDGR